MRVSTKLFFLWLGCSVVLFGPSSLQAMARKPLPPSKPRFSSWLTYWDRDNGNAALNDYADKMEHVSLFGLDFDKDERLVSAFGPLELPLKKCREIPGLAKKEIYLTAVNDVIAPGGNRLKDPVVVHNILSSPEKMNAHIDELLTFGGPFDGIEIDYENLWVQDRETFSTFIFLLAKKAHEKGKKVSVVVEPQRWGLTGAIDWKAVSASADMVKVMAYYEHYSGSAAGPIASPEWVLDITEFALNRIPRNKLCIALVLGGIDWLAGKKGSTIDFNKAMELAKQFNAQIKRDKGQSPSFTYSYDYIESGKHTVWLEDNESLQRKMDLLKRAGVLHIALWRLGNGDPSFWIGLPKEPVPEPMLKR